MTRQTKSEDEGASLTCTKCGTEHQLEPGQFLGLKRQGLEEETFCCEMFGRNCIIDSSSESDFENFGKSSFEDMNCLATEGVGKQFLRCVPSYMEDWIQEAKDSNLEESDFVQWLKDFEDDNLHIHLHINEDTWLTTSAIEDTFAEAEVAEGDISIEELLRPCDSEDGEHISRTSDVEDEEAQPSFALTYVKKEEENNLMKDEEPFPCVHEEKEDVVIFKNMKQSEEPEKKDGGPFDPSKNEEEIEKKRDDESFTCVREEKDNVVFDESIKQREEPEQKDGGPFDPSKNEQSIEKKEDDIF